MPSLKQRVEALEEWAESLPYRMRPSSQPKPVDREAAPAEEESEATDEE